MIYENPRFGFRLPIPPGMKPTRPPMNGDGQNFISLDSSVALTAWGSFNVDNFGDVDARRKAALAQPDVIITYQRKTDHWFVISGTNSDGTAFYERAFRSGDRRRRQPAYGLSRCLDFGDNHAGDACSRDSCARLSDWAAVANGPQFFAIVI